jgi:hypothetical protein
LFLLRLALVASAGVVLEIDLDRVYNPAAASISASALAEATIPAPRDEKA